ncbi:NlpC/P60 family protein [Actinomyces succiniciruminis]|uniref:Peptidase n=1 Tax=Actinomyces succiniciruminis TaxID=1522002 RepID=A0A1L7RPN2_9ACTO|nr:bifunctional lytic transglycosylase/C40 family peptidase [Actinomyces succiniciruminis]CED91304.1 Peptidase [Actinomyces succiniciruminis]
MKKTGLIAVLPLLLVLPIIIMGGGDSSAQEPTTAGSVSVTGVPDEYLDVVTRAGGMCDAITAPLLAAQIQVESGWTAVVSSDAGANGIAQFIPSTWAQYGMDGDGDGVADVNNPQDAIMGQANYMCVLSEVIQGWLDQGVVNGSLTELTLAAYNAGEGAVHDHGGIPPYKETQEYVPAILELVPQYTAEGGTVTAASSGGDSSTAQTAIVAAKAQLGIPYVWGGESDAGVDCSGMVMRAYAAAGIALPHDSRQQYGSGTKIPRAEAQPGDLLFWSYTGQQADIYHVAMYLGDGMLIDANFTPGVSIRAVWESEIMPYAVRPY